MQVTAWPAFKNRKDNPYNFLLYTHIARLGVEVEEFTAKRVIFKRHDVWHIHWPEYTLDASSLIQSGLRLCALGILLGIAKIKGTKIVWTAHNLHSHEARHPRLESLLWRFFMPWFDGCIALSETGQATALEHHPQLGRCQWFVIPHGHYRGSYPDTVGRGEARSSLGLAPDARVLVFFGQVRPYKDVTHLIDVFRRVTDPDLTLVIAGKPNSDDLADQIREAASADTRVRLYLRFVPDDEVQLYLRAADLVVLPYREILNSGSAILALSFARPVLVPDQGAMGELQRSVGREWVHTYQGRLDPDDLRRALDCACRGSQDPESIFNALSWEDIARQTHDAYCAISGRRRE